jgi:hypothetical protein
MIALRRLLTVAPLLLAGACATAPPPQASTWVDLEEVQRAVWEDRDLDALALLDALRWERTGSVAAERLQQDLRIARGERVAVVEELIALQARHPDDPDLAYLRARILEDPQRRAEVLIAALRRHPQHVWLRLGMAATAQTLDDWRRARRLLEGLPARQDTAEFRRVILARQAAREGAVRAALELLEDAAFVAGEEGALLTWIEIADKSGEPRLLRRGLAELGLRRGVARGLATDARIDTVFARLEAEQPWLAGADLNTVLRAIDDWCAVIRVPSGWLARPRYAAPPFAELVRPEPSGGGPGADWAEAGRVLLAGTALGRGTEVHLLQDVEVLSLDWPGERRPLEVLVSRRARSASGVLPLGGAVLRGFFLRLDQAESAARSVESALTRFRSAPPRPELLPEAGALESWDLPQRLRASSAASGTAPRRAALAALVIHEAGHLPETLPWTRYGIPVLRLLPRFGASLIDYGDPVLWLEYHAQLRALASGRATRWLLAETVGRANSPRDPYHGPYRRLLEDLVELAAEQDLPHLALWDALPPERLAQLARALAEREQVSLLPEGGLMALDELIARLSPAAGESLPAQIDPAE